MIKNLFFYNNWHNGDLHVSRGIVNYIVNFVKDKNPNIKFYYGHYNNKEILKDLPVIYDSNYLQYLNDKKHESFFVKDESLFINTWYGVSNYSYYNEFGPTFDCVFELMKAPAKQVGIDLNKVDIKDLMPVIDFNKYEIKNIDLSFMDGKVNLYISNGEVYSQQTSNHNMNTVIRRLADQYKNINFILTNIVGNKLTGSNIYYTQDLIKKNGCDLNENAFISTKCDIIIGRASGTYTFALNTVNLFERECKIVCLSDYPEQFGDFWLGKTFSGKIKYKSCSDNYNTKSLSDIYRIINTLIMEKLNG
jgi:hypothetical protein